MPPRRIQPELIAPLQDNVLTLDTVSVTEQQLEVDDEPGARDLRKQAALAKDVLGPGRMLFVELDPAGNTSVNWEKVQSESQHLASQASARRIHP